MFIGGGSEHDSLRVGSAYDWNPGAGNVITWHPTPSSLAKARQAPATSVPPSSMQAGHLRGYVEFRERGLDYSRTVMGSWDVPGKCDIRAMTYLINAHLRRQATYHSWFEYRDEKNIIRHTIKNPRDINFVPKEYGVLTQQQWHDHVQATPDPLQWDCFRFGVIQHDDRFTLYAVVDHLHCDPMLLSGLYIEILMNYTSILEGKAPVALPPANGYDEFCLRESQTVESMTLDSPEVRTWVDFAEANGGTLPDFPLPLGDQSIPCGGDVHVEQLLGSDKTADFEALCQRAGARFSGGLFACLALAHYEMTGAETYYGLTPTDKRKSPEDFLTVGWFTGVVPFTVPVDPTSFEETARAAQASFDANMNCAQVPYDRVLELAPWLQRPGPQFTMVSYMDAGLPPLSGVVATALDGVNATAFTDGRSPAYMYSTVFRLFDEVSIMVSYPNNPIARESVMRFTAQLKSVFERVVAGRLSEVAVRVAR
ncbi:condensation domain-containing protein [Mycobacterium sp. Marseille-P9652]|uniref:condensation domain-containing protein n=1 Tax=Mycobacterium sp. Marseille-P9652 TaxID=2654950 RepID=UPI0012E8B9F8|nr:condensation domain-containing protein [Mycobacterium sp. Marseille-P9652]